MSQSGFIRALLFVLLLSVFCTAGTYAFAQEEAEPPQDALKETVKLAAQVDAYNVYCKGEDGLGAGVIARYGANEPEERKADLERIRGLSFESMSKRLAEKKLECNSGDFLMEKFSIMQQLKILLAGFLGVDPNTQKLDGSPLPPPPTDLQGQMKEKMNSQEAAP